MKFSAQEEFGLRCLISLAREGEGGFLTIPQISEREALSQSHAAKLLSALRKAGFVTSVRGQLGGYSLAREAKDISIPEVLIALGGRLYDSGFCMRHSGQADTCVHDTDCSLRPLWNAVQNAVDRAVASYTLADLLEGTVNAPNAVMQSRPPERLQASGASK
ncbi:MAG: Rrf2 family transcriptional regulator [Fimbriimonadaceae bacterium]|nr:Rrf2 family transcriptional regulator [Fimbriimonadaceae bacterium]